MGTTVEFQSRGSFAPLTDMVGGGPFGLKPGQWTDDTSMALCLAESLLETGGFDPGDQLTRYLRWFRLRFLCPHFLLRFQSHRCLRHTRSKHHLQFVLRLNSHCRT